VGIALALACAAATQLGFLCKHRGANKAQRVEWQRPLSSAKSLLGSKWFAIGLGIGAGAFALHVAALSLAPLSTVQAVLSTGVVMLAVLGDRLFGHSVGSRQWVGVGMTASGLGLLVLTLPSPDGTGAAFHVPGLIAFEAATLALGTLLIVSPRLGAPVHHHGALLGASAGVLFGVSDVAIKALTGSPLVSPWLLIAVTAAVLAFFASARGFQEGDAVPVIACTSTAANVTCIIGGILVFGDALAAGLLLFVQIAAFGLIAVAALVTPTGQAQTATA
jgi:drug/metabolite transporter (DMT)-like permease